MSGGSVKLALMGGFALVRSDGNQVHLANRKACAILAYLTLNPNRSETRERLAGLLWSERSEDQARASLRQCLKQIRTLFDSIGFEGFRTERQDVGLNGNHITCDLILALSGLERGEVLENLLTAEANPERILYGFENIDQSFSAWLQVLRQQHQNALIDNLQKVLLAGGGVAKKAAEALVIIDATHEEAHRFLIHYRADSGNTAAALAQYERLWNLLDEEYDVEPALETQELIVTIKTGEYQRAAPTDNLSPSNIKGTVTPNEASTTKIPTIGIGYFSNVDLRPNDHLISGNFRREIIASMTRFREWIIVDSSTDDEVSDYIVDGSTVQSSDGLVCILTLLDKNTKRYVWSEKVNISRNNWFEAQQALIRRISISLNVYLSADRLKGASLGTAQKMDGYDQWLQGQNEMLYWNPMNEAKAEMTLRDIIEKSPAFAPAYGCLAAVYNTRHFKNPGIYRHETAVQEALRLSKIAVGLDPLDTRNQLALAWSNAMSGRFDQAEIYFNLAHDLNPNSPTTIVPCAHGLSYCGDRVKARLLAEFSARQNPSMPQFQWGYIGCIRYLDGDYESAAEALETAGDIITDLVAWRAAALAMAGNKDSARQEAEKFIQLARNNWQGEGQATQANITNWLIHCFPIKKEIDRATLHEGLQKAGLHAIEMAGV